MPFGLFQGDQRTYVYYPNARIVLSIIFDGDSMPDEEPSILNPDLERTLFILPQEVTVHRNSYRQADSFDITFAANDLPIDPQMIRAAFCEIYLFETDGLKKDQELISAQNTLYSQNITGSESLSALDSLKADKLSKGRFTHDNPPVVVGLVDDVSADYSSSGRTVSMSGQDYTAYFLTRQWPPVAGKGATKGVPKRIPTNRRLDDILRGILKEADPSGKMELSVEVDGSIPTVRDEVRGKRRGISVEQNTSYWDVMYGLASRYGFLLFVRGLDVVLTAPDGYKGDSRRLAWGKNIESLSIQRNIGKQRAPRIVAKGYNEKTKETVTAEYPPNPELKQVGAKSGRNSSFELNTIPAGTVGVNEDEYKIIPVYGVSDVAVLEQIAKKTFYLIGRGEYKIVATTRDLTDLDANGMLSLATGDAVHLQWEEFNVDHALLRDDKVPQVKKIQHLRDKGYNYQVAEVIVSQYERAIFDRNFYVKEVSYQYSASDGISIEIEMVEFANIDGVRNPDNPKPSKTLGLPKVSL